MEGLNPSIEVIVALDFGTSRSGYAYTFRAEKEKVDLKTDWGKYAPPYCKTRTCLLYSPEDEVVDWGTVAIERLAENRTFTDKGYYIIDRFKMQIKNKDGKYRTEESDGKLGEIYQTPVSGKELKVFDLVVDFLRLLKEEALSEVKKSTVFTLTNKQIQWVLTVPAIWEDDDKQFMRDAAIKSGIISSLDEDDNRLIFALEPEAAACYCHRKGELGLSSGIFMVVDCGGGTVDITSYSINSAKKMVGIEGVSPKGGPHGSTFIDTNFRSHIANKFSWEAVKKFKDENPLEYLRSMEYDWETIKCSVTTKKLTQNPFAFFEIKRSLKNLVKKLCSEKFKELVTSQNNDEDYIHLSPDEIKSFFTPTIHGLFTKIKEEFHLLGQRKCNTMVLVGGYSRSELLQSEVKKEFSNWVDKIVTVQNPELAVLFGAIYFAMNPQIPRVSKRTYGCAVSRKFKPGDPITKQKWSNTEQCYYCIDLFSIFVKAGQLVDYDYKVVNIYIAVEKDAKNIEFTFYSTEDPNPKYVDDQGVSKYTSKITFTRESISSGKNWEIEITMYFGRTEIKVEGKDTDTGIVKNLKIDFRSRFY